MRAHTIELLRFGGDAGVVRSGDHYLLVHGEAAAADQRVDLGYREFVTCMHHLRYGPGTAQGDRDAALCTLRDAALALFEPALAALGADATQLDVVVSANELCAIPFEAMLRDHPELVLTRRVRGRFGESRPWPDEARVLYAFAEPDRDVPHAAHRAILEAAVEPWSPPAGDARPDLAARLTVVEHATLDALERACAQAVEEGRPFTHVHLLAHGVGIPDLGGLARRGVALEGDMGPDHVDGPRLLAALTAGGHRPTVVSLCACEGADRTDSFLPGADLTDHLHRAGIPVVVGAQLPLTIDGSKTYAERFFAPLLAGEDVRAVLRDTRRALREAHPEWHDDVALVAYVRLPEGYADDRLRIRLRAELRALETASKWADHLSETDSARLPEVAETLEARVRALSACAEAAKNAPVQVLSEATGLLASGSKRLGEVLWRAGHAERSRSALEAAHRHYATAHRADPANFWVGEQALALEAAITGRIERPGLWWAAFETARAKTEERDEVWAWGTLVGLNLLGELVGQPRPLVEAEAALRALVERADQSRHLDSTRRQLTRFADWWTASNGYFPGRADLSTAARHLLGQL